MTREQLQARLAAYLAAESKILESQEYLIGNGATARRNVRADLAEVRKGIQDTRDELARLDVGTQRARRVVYLRPF